jgi:hypothetical protein
LQIQEVSKSIPKGNQILVEIVATAVSSGCTEKFDIIFDAIGKNSKKQCKSLLNKNGFV